MWTVKGAPIKKPDKFKCPRGITVQMFKTTHKTDQTTPKTEILILKSDNLQYNTLGRWVDRLIDQASDGPSIILID